MGGTGNLDHAYPGTSISGAAQMFRLATAVRRNAESMAPLTTQLVVITNPDDDQVDYDDIDALTARVRRPSAVGSTARPRPTP